MWKGDWLPRSVTQVLSSDMTPEKLAAIMRYKDGPDGWAARGEAIHAALETHLAGESISFDNRWAPWVDALLDCELFHGAEVIATEYRLCDEGKGLGGSFDFLLNTRQGIVLGDLKTVKTKAAGRKREPATRQLGAYAAMLGNFYPWLPIDQCVTVVAAPGECRVLSQDPDDCLGEWVDAWDVYKMSLEEW